MIRMLRKPLLALFLVFLLGPMFISCSGDKTVFEEYQKFEKLSWNRFNILSFNMPVTDISMAYDIYINVRHLPEIPNKSISINLTLYSPSGDMRSVDFAIALRDADGNPLSNCLGDYCDRLMLLRSDFKFHEPGEVRFEIENKYSKVDLPGILEIGLIVKEAEQQ